MPSSTPAARSASGGRRKPLGWLPWALALLLALIILVVVLVVSNLDDDEDGAVTAAPPAALLGADPSRATA